MKKLPGKTKRNTPQEYDRIFLLREEKGVDPFDLRRWKMLLRFYKGGRLADLGCLDSLVGVIAKKKYPKSQVFGLDKAKGAIAAMQKRHPEVAWSCGDIEKEFYPGEYFVYVVLGEVLEHVQNPQAVVNEAYRILRKGGTLALSVPYDEAREPGAVDLERHLWSFDKEDIQDLLKSFGKVSVRVLRTRENEKYQFPVLIAYAQK